MYADSVDSLEPRYAKGGIPSSRCNANLFEISLAILKSRSSSEASLISTSRACLPDLVRLAAKLLQAGEFGNKKEQR